MTRLDELLQKFEKEIAINEPLSVDAGDGLLIDLRELVGEVRKVVSQRDKLMKAISRSTKGQYYIPTEIENIYDEVQKEMESEK